MVDLEEYHLMLLSRHNLLSNQHDYLVDMNSEATFLPLIFLQEQEKRQISFQGMGRTLGSSTPPSGGAESSDATPLNAALTPSEGLVVDQTLPSTSIQLRLADGTRMVSHFNHHHTIGDIRAFIDASRPGCSRNYQLQTVGFPPKQLTNHTQTIEQAGLANSVVILKS